MKNVDSIEILKRVYCDCLADSNLFFEAHPSKKKVGVLILAAEITDSYAVVLDLALKSENSFVLSDQGRTVFDLNSIYAADYTASKILPELEMFIKHNKFSYVIYYEMNNYGDVCFKTKSVSENELLDASIELLEVLRFIVELYEKI